MARLKRELGLASSTIFGISVIVGAGIYALIGAATAVAGAGVWLSFVIAAFVALLTGLSYAELASMMPQAGSSFLYVFKGLKSKLLGFITGWLILFEAVVGAAAIAMAFGSYLASVVAFPVLPAAFICILIFSIVNLVGIKESMRLNTVMFILEVGGLLFVIAAGFLFGSANPDLIDFQLTPVLAGAALVFFAMLGFEMIAAESEEAKDAVHTIPRAIILSIIICTVLYALFSVSALLLVGPEVLGASTAPVKDVVFPLLGEYSFLFALIALASTANTVLICLITASRLSYGMAKGSSLPKTLGRVNRRFCTPHYSVLFSFAVAALFLLLANMVIIAEVTNFAALLAFFLINLAVIGLRISRPGTRRPFRIPLSVANVPIPAVLGALASLFLVAYLSLEAILYGIGLTLLGGAVHLIYERVR
ncbi:MAG: amino acid permease [Candidatus ainarchaeum sp.]|nr:amino acid permease [Candidatus ainarchaeum sp.]